MSNSMGRPKEARDIMPHMRGAVKANPDGTGYLLADSGCIQATLYLKHPSLCLECPFPQCYLEGRKPNAQ